MNELYQISAILLAGGQGTRMKSSLPKQYLPLKNKPLALYSFELLVSCPQIFEVIVVCEENYRSIFNHPKVQFAMPGTRRQDSVFNGFSKISHHSNLVCIHDSARPLLQSDDLQRVIAEGARHGAATLAIPVNSTIKEIDSDGFVVKTLNRSVLYEIQTPQVIKTDLLKEGFILANQKNLTVTDEVSLVELLGKPVKRVTGSYRNLKITIPEDLAIAETYLS